MEKITKLDQALTKLFETFPSLANEISFTYVCPLSDQPAIEKLNYGGLYRIDMHTGGGPNEVGPWIAALQLEWEHKDFKKKFTANFKKKRIKQHKALPEWMPLYIGKSKNVGKRVLEHLNLELHKTTFALKINARPTMSQRLLRLSTIELQVENYNIIAPALESALRDRINPLIGKQ